MATWALLLATEFQLWADRRDEKELSSLKDASWKPTQHFHTHLTDQKKSQADNPTAKEAGKLSQQEAKNLFCFVLFCFTQEEKGNISFWWQAFLSQEKK